MLQNEDNEFVGPGKLFESEEDELTEKVEFLEWATQAPPEEVEALMEAISIELRGRQ
jgi:hypothetical protein